LIVALSAVSLSLSCAAQADNSSRGEKRMSLTLRSPSFAHEAEIPTQFTCQGEDISPALEWSDLPAATKSLVLIVDDPDAPDPKAPKITWVHWLLYDIPATSTGLPEGGKPLPQGTREGTNNWKRTGYGGPCPPIGRHRYFHKLYALDTLLGDIGAPTKDALLAAMKGHVIAETALIGTYQKR